MKKATTNETTFICVKPIIKAEYTIRIVGDSPLLVHAWSEKAKKEMLQAQQGKKLLKKDKVAKNPAGECAELSTGWMASRTLITATGRKICCTSTARRLALASRPAPSRLLPFPQHTALAR